MKAIFEDRTRQYTVKVGDVIAIDKIEGVEEGTTIFFDKVLMLTDDNNKTSFGKPYIPSVKVGALVINNTIRDPKIIVLKFKRRKNYIRKKGHKQERTLVKIESIA